MRLIGTRWFSLSVPQSRQALYTPYIEPMNKGQEKTVRRLLLRKEPSLHPRIPTDVNRILQLHSPNTAALKKRAATIKWLNELIPATFGEHFSVRDVSLSQYAQDLEYAPLELVIIDDSRKAGFPPGTKDESRIGPYDPMNIVMLLQVHGLTGSLIDGDVHDLVPQVDNIPTVEELDPPPEYPSWFEPRLFSVPYIRYPVVIRAEGTEQFLSFHLSPPMPTLPPLIKLLKAYLCTDLYKTLVTFVYFWVRTIGLEQLTPTCVALMVIVFLQNKKGVPSLQDPTDQPVEELRKAATGVWVTADFPPRFSPQSFYIETGFFNKEIGSSVVDKQIKAYLYDFFEFWATHNSKSTVVASEQIFSVKSGRNVPRLTATKKDAAARIQIQEWYAKIQRGLEAWSPLEPPITWCHQYIVIEDPFIPSFNHARTLSPHTTRFFHNAASVSQRTLRHGQSVYNILGHALSHHKRQYSTATLSQQVRDSYKRLNPSRQVYDRRKLTISRIEKVLKKEFGNQFHLLNFGSTRYGVSVASSDLDLVVIDPDHPVGFTPHTKLSNLPRIYSVRSVGQILASYQFVNVYIIPTASVPIVKCRDPTTGIDCDININDRLGLINTYLVDNYCKIAPNIRPMCVAIKRWAKYCNLNDSSGAFGPRTFNSYTLVMMVIGYLQMKGILPNLQEGYPPLPSNPRQGIFYITRKKKAILCDTRFRSVDKDTIQVEFDLGEVLLGWFNFWGNEFVHTTQLLSIRDGGCVERHIDDQDKLMKKLKRKNKKGKERADSTIDEKQLEMDEELSVARDTEDDDIAAWREQQEELGDVISEGLSAELNELEVEDGTIAEASETAMAPSILSEDSKELMQDKIKPWDDIFVVADPFDRAKNLTSHFGLALLNQFQSECRSAAELIKSGGTLDDLIPVDHAESKDEVGDDDPTTSTKNKQKPRLGIPIKPRGPLKNINMIDNSSSRSDIRRPKRNDSRRNGRPVTSGGNSIRPQEPPRAGPSTLNS